MYSLLGLAIVLARKLNVRTTFKYQRVLYNHIRINSSKSRAHIIDTVSRNQKFSGQNLSRENIEKFKIFLEFPMFSSLAINTYNRLSQQN